MALPFSASAAEAAGALAVITAAARPRAAPKARGLQLELVAASSCTKTGSATCASAKVTEGATAARPAAL